MANPETRRYPEDLNGLKHANIDVVYGVNADVPGRNIVRLINNPNFFSVRCVIFPYNKALVLYPVTEIETEDSFGSPSEDWCVAINRIQSIKGAIETARSFCLEWEGATPNEGILRTFAVHPRNLPQPRFHAFFQGEPLDDGLQAVMREEYKRLKEQAFKFNLRVTAENDQFAEASENN